MDKAAAIKTAKEILIECGFAYALLSLVLIIFLPDPWYLLGYLLSFSVFICLVLDGVKSIYISNKSVCKTTSP